MGSLPSTFLTMFSYRPCGDVLIRPRHYRMEVEAGCRRTDILRCACARGETPSSL